MGLVHCSDCHKLVSEKAEICVHCGAPRRKTICDENLKNEHNFVVQKTSDKHAKYLKEREKIELYYKELLLEEETRTERFKTTLRIVAVIAGVILLFHLLNPNWWLLLTIPFCLGFILAGIIGPEDNPYSDQPSRKYQLMDQRKKELQELEYKYNRSN